MNKIISMIVLSFFVVVGSVYATWTYAQTKAKPVADTISATIAGSTSTTEKGTITIDDNNLTITIDDTDNNYEAEIVISGEMNITFAPAKGADAIVVSDGIKLQFTLTAPTNCQYLEDDIFTITTTPQPLNSGSAGLNAKIASTDLENLIILKNTIKLDTKEKYTAFQNAIANKTIAIEISEAD